MGFSIHILSMIKIDFKVFLVGFSIFFKKEYGRTRSKSIFIKSLDCVVKYLLTNDTTARHSGPDCKMYSSNNKGPCINGGKLTCKGDEVAPIIICECPLNYNGVVLRGKDRKCMYFSLSCSPHRQGQKINTIIYVIFFSVYSFKALYQYMFYSVPGGIFMNIR